MGSIVLNCFSPLLFFSFNNGLVIIIKIIIIVVVIAESFLGQGEIERGEWGASGKQLWNHYVSDAKERFFFVCSDYKQKNG